MSEHIIAKQVIVVRRDLKMPVGKVAAQVAHASMAVILNQMGRFGPIENQIDARTLAIDLSNPHMRALQEWIDGPFTKVVVGIDSEQDLVDLYNFAKEAGIPVSKIEDEGRTVFNGVRTLTCCAFGPCYSDVLDNITGHLKLLNK